jgi:hypothetical protein
MNDKTKWVLGLDGKPLEDRAGNRLLMSSYDDVVPWGKKKGDATQRRDAVRKNGFDAM